MSDILVAVPVYNAEKYIEKCIASLKMQNYEDFQCIIVDDASTDSTYEKAKELVKNDDRFTVIKNEENQGVVSNFVKMIDLGNTNEETIICTLDGDDWLISKDALNIVKRKYEDTNCLLTHGTYVHSNGSLAPIHHRNPIPASIKRDRSYRKNTFLTSQLRTFKKKLWDQIDKQDLKNSKGEYYKSGGDLAFMFPMCEMAGSRIEYIEEPIYCYNIGNPINDHKVNRQKQLRTDREIRKKKKYDNLETSFKGASKKVLLETFARTGSNYLTCLLYFLYDCPVEGSALAYPNPEEKFKNPSNTTLRIHKTHRSDSEPGLSIEREYYNDEFDLFVTIIRSPLEAVVRHNEHEVNSGREQGTKWFCGKTEDFIIHYNTVLEDYKEFNGSKVFIYYEDLMKNPKIELQKIIDTFSSIGLETVKTIEECCEKLIDIKNWCSEDHRFVNRKDDKNTKFNPYRHQKGIPEEIFYEYKENFKNHKDLVGHYFDNYEKNILS